MKKKTTMNKTFSKRQLYSGMQGKVERMAQRDYERRMVKHKKAMKTFDDMVKDLEKRTKKAKELGIMVKAASKRIKAPTAPVLAKVRKVKRSLRQKRMRY